MKATTGIFRARVSACLQATSVVDVAPFRVALAGAALMLSSGVMAQDDPGSACRQAAVYFEDGDLEGALDEARWCVESLEQIKQQQTLSLFPDELGGYVGGELSSQNTMGMTIMNRTYSSDSDTIDVTLTGGGAAAAGMAALMQFGASGQGKKMRVQRRTVMDMSEPGNAQFIVQMKSSGMLTFESSSVDGETVLAFVKEFPIADIDDALASQ